ncbi:hypothetical protein CASFOL_029966 [Castilleja foliolosa]|uniref:Uncharacterized protein n=1 Tax=Castilleja foliolosa TaxID=1961234 RepID=A0ABD3CCH7_9LAMI
MATQKLKNMSAFFLILLFVAMAIAEPFQNEDHGEKRELDTVMKSDQLSHQLILTSLLKRKSKRPRRTHWWKKRRDSDDETDRPKKRRWYKKRHDSDDETDRPKKRHFWSRSRPTPEDY